jgi:hypothetical protein
VSAHVELALAIHLQHPGASRVLPRRRLRIVALAARPPSDWLTLPSPALRAAARGCVPSGTRPAIATHSVVAFPAASAPAATRLESAPPCPGDAAPGSSANRSLASSTTATTASAPAASAHSTRALPSACNNPHHVAAVIVQHRQWTDRLLPAQSAFEVHLPQLIGLAASKRSTAGGWRSSGCTRPRHNRMRWMVLWVRLTLWPCNSTRNLCAPQSG